MEASILKKLSVALCVASVFGISVAYADGEGQTGEGQTPANNGYTTASGQIHFAGVVTKTAPTILVKVLSSTNGREFGLDNSANNIISLGDYSSADFEQNATFNILVYSPLLPASLALERRIITAFGTPAVQTIKKKE